MTCLKYNSLGSCADKIPLEAVVTMSFMGELHQYSLDALVDR